MKYLLDTNICIYYIKGKFDLFNKFKGIGFDNLFISEITVAELKFGIAKSAHPEKNKLVINEFVDRLKLIRIYDSLDIFAEERARLQKAGLTVDNFDLLIGATAVRENIVLVTNNVKHFKRIRDIRIENWTESTEI